MRKVLFSVFTAAVGLIAFGATSLAVGSPGSPRLRSNLPAAQRPVIALDQQARVQIHNLIGAQQAERFGITADSYAEARHIAQTSIGPVYLIPGADGACLVVGTMSTGCGDPGAPGERMLAVLVSTSPDAPYVGAGVTSDAVQRIVISGKGAPDKSVRVRNGIFTVSAANGVARPAGAAGPGVEIGEG